MRIEAPAGTDFAAGSFYASNYKIQDGEHTAYTSAEVSPEGRGEDVADVFVPFAIKDGDTILITAFSVSNTLSAGDDAFSVSTSSDTEPVSKKVTISPAAGVSNVSVASSDTVGGEDTTVTVSFRATSPLSDGAGSGSCCQQGYIRLQAPPGSEFGYQDQVSDGSGATEGASGETNPESLGANVVDIYVPFAVQAGDIVHVMATLFNPASASSTDTFSIATSSDVIPVTVPFQITEGTLPELGRCVAVEPARVVPANSGYADAKCTKPASGGDASYEWLAPGPAKHFESRFGKVKFESVAGTRVICASGGGLDQYTGARTETGSVIFSGCALSSTKAQCQSEGASSGEIETSTLRGSLGFIDQKKHTAGWDLNAASGAEGAIATFKCGSDQLSLGGSVVAPIRPIDRMGSIFTMKFKSSGGKQTPERLEGQPTDTLTLALDGEPAAAGLSATETIEDQEALEIKAIA